MANLSIEQRAHDLALLTVQLDVQSKINGPPGTYNIDMVTSYIAAYNDALDALNESKKDIRQSRD